MRTQTFSLEKVVFLTLLLDKNACFLPLLLVLGLLLDIFHVFLPQLLDIFYNFASEKENKNSIIFWRFVCQSLLQ